MGWTLLLALSLVAAGDLPAGGAPAWTGADGGAAGAATTLSGPGALDDGSATLLAARRGHRPRRARRLQLTFRIRLHATRTSDDADDARRLVTQDVRRAVLAAVPGSLRAARERLALLAHVRKASAPPAG